MTDHTNARTAARIENDFIYHPPKPGAQDDFAAIRAQAMAFAQDVNARVPDGREKALGLLWLEEVVMWANAGLPDGPGERGQS